MATADRSYKHILIVKLSAIGDVVHALPVSQAVKQCFPEARLTWVVEKPSYDLLANNPYIDEIIVFDKPRFKSLAGLLKHGPALVKSLRSRHFDLALDLQALFKSAAIAYLSGAPERLVYCNTRELSDLFSRRVCGPNQAGHVVERYLDVVRALGCEIDNVQFPIHITEQEAASARTVAGQAGLADGQPYIVLAPGANWPNKRWPAPLFALLADSLRDAGLIPVLAGGPGDRAMAAGIIASAKAAPVDLTGKTSLKELAHLLKHARAFVGGDTGPMHLAAALATPVVALYGPTDIVRNGPYGPGHKTIITPRECAGCWKRACPKGEDCLAAIDADSVCRALQEIVERNDRRQP
ncbi:MAG TPA: lipopolysaccharide heptosyltransferase II [Selenomonadales bacterium]|nr:lipopolysaccharide heptosyltransferase II [Selenomonadales bacterium]